MTNNKIIKLIRKVKKQQIIILALLILIIMSFTIAFGRYVTNTINNFFVRSKEFYFFSDKLSDDNSVYQVDNWSGVDDYVITINMNSNNNNIEVATYDIGYDISYQCTSNAICQLSKTSGTILAGTNSDFFNLTITPNTVLSNGDKVSVEVEVKSNAPYKKTLKGKFTLIVGEEKLSYQITDKEQSPYIILSMTNTLSYYKVKEQFGTYSVGQKIDFDTYLKLTDEEQKKCYSAIAQISFDPKDILLDITSTAYSDATSITTTTIDGKTYINGFMLNIDAISSREIRFYKVDISKNYTYPNRNNTSIVSISSK